MKIKTLAMFLAAASGAEFKSMKDKIEGSYIVVMKQGTSDSVVEQHKTTLRGMSAEISHEYGIGEHFKGYAANMDKATLAQVMEMDEVDFVEENAVVTASIPLPEESEEAKCVTQTGATWGLVRTSEKDEFINGEYSYNDASAGQGVTAYVIDTGIYLDHNEFEGRAEQGFDATGEGSGDLNGHGTHVAGTVGGAVYGIAKQVTLKEVKVLKSNGSGSTAGVIAGVNYVAGDCKGACTGNMSLGGGFSSANNEAVNAAVRAGVTMVVAAGNNNGNACNYSPASADDAITVVASDNRDYRSSFSNYGTCTDIIAPGSSITAAWIGGKNSINTISGTSMASPHVCGVVARYLSANSGASPKDVQTWLDSKASDGKITNSGTGTPNKLLYGACDF